MHLQDSSPQALIDLGQRYWLPVYRPREVVLDHGKGARVWDTEGRDYVDFGAGIAVNALGHVRVTMRSSLLGALVMPPAYLVGLHWGATGLAYAWLLAFPVLPLFTFSQARGTLGITLRQLAAAVAPGLLASAAMALAVLALARAIPLAAAWQRLGLEVGFGAACYAGLLLVFSRATLLELVGLALRRRQGMPAATA